MTIAQRKLLIALLSLCCSTAVVAADAPKAEPAKDAKADQKDDKKDEKKDGKDVKEAKPEAPAEPDLPSKPYPKNASPKAFEPKREAKADAGHDKAADKSADKAADKGADKTAAKPVADKAADKHADKGGDKHGDKHAADKQGDKHGDKAGDAHTVTVHKTDTPPRKVMKKARPAQAKPSVPVDPAMAEVAREAASLKQNARSSASYVVQARDNLDSVIRKTLPSNLFANDVLRQAYLRANPGLVSTANVKLRAGQVLQIPDAATVRAVVMGEGGGYEVKPALHSTAPVVAPTIAPTANDLNPPIAIPRLPVDVASSHRPAPEVSAEEKKKWVRYP